MPFTFKKLDLQDVILIEPKVFPDDRGYFLETFKESEFKAFGIDVTFLQDNHSVSKKGVLRGLHYQLPPKAQGKLVRVMKGKAFDVAVDVRESSPTFLDWVAVELSEKNNKMLYIPPGFAHGFMALTDEVHLLYKCTNEFDASADGGIRWDEPDIGIPWPGNDFVISEKDRELPYLKNAILFK